MKGERRETLDDKLARLAQINIGYRIPPATSPDWPALSALAQIFGGGESSRLYQRLVKEKELCSSIGSGSGARMGHALFGITCSVRAGKSIDEAEATITEEVSKLQSSPVTAPELTRVRTSARRSAVGIRESALGRAQSLADNAILYNDPNRINTVTDGGDRGRCRSRRAEVPADRQSRRRAHAARSSVGADGAKHEVAHHEEDT
jgi:zinc protease